jgi:hypothetical protein
MGEDNVSLMYSFADCYWILGLSCSTYTLVFMFRMGPLNIGGPGLLHQLHCLWDQAWPFDVFFSRLMVPEYFIAGDVLWGMCSKR